MISGKLIHRKFKLPVTDDEFINNSKTLSSINRKGLLLIMQPDRKNTK
jgi:hypothetical protein